MPSGALRSSARGHTLLELAIVLTLFATTTAVLSPPLARYRDVAAVVSARESVAGLIAAARVVAVANGGAEVHVRAGPSVASLIVGGDTTRVVRVESDSGVVLDLGPRTAVVLAYDEVGMGRLANATIRFVRGDESRSLVVSSFGRVRRP
jgi:Tfp pilus assembly protein FimT